MFFGGAASAGTAHDDGDVVGGVVSEKIGLLNSLTSRDDGELRVAVGAGNDSRCEMLGGVEVDDLGGLGVTNSRIAIREASATDAIGVMPVVPAKREVWKSAMEFPIGVMQPNPVTTTRFTADPPPATSFLVITHGERCNC